MLAALIINLYRRRQQQQQEHEQELQSSTPHSASSTAQHCLLQLPSPALGAVVAKLPHKSRQSLRLACKTGQARVDRDCTRHLRMTWEGPFKPGMPARFPFLAHLDIDGSNRDLGSAMKGLLPNGEAWPSVTRLTLARVLVPTALRLIAACPNVQTCKLVDLDRSFDSLTAGLRTALCSLPRLGSLALEGHSFVAADLQQLSRRSFLTQLSGHLSSSFRTQGWAGLAAMHGQLASLDLSLMSHEQPEGALAAFSQLTCLTALHLSDDSRDDSVPMATLCLPSTLVSLSLEHLRLPAVALPHLTALSLIWSRTDTFGLVDAGVAALAEGSRQLRSLTVDRLSLTKACHSTPLLCLTQLTVGRQLVVGEGTRLAMVCPGLCELVLGCTCKELRKSMEGMTALRSLSFDLGPKFAQTYSF